MEMNPTNPSLPDDLELGGDQAPAALPAPQPPSPPVAAEPEADQLFDTAEIDLIPRPPLDPDAMEAA